MHCAEYFERPSIVRNWLGSKSLKSISMLYANSIDVRSSMKDIESKRPILMRLTFVVRFGIFWAALFFWSFFQNKFSDLVFHKNTKISKEKLIHYDLFSRCCYKGFPQ